MDLGGPLSKAELNAFSGSAPVAASPTANFNLTSTTTAAAAIDERPPAASHAATTASLTDNHHHQYYVDIAPDHGAPPQPTLPPPTPPLLASSSSSSSSAAPPIALSFVGGCNADDVGGGNKGGGVDVAGTKSERKTMPHYRTSSSHQNTDEQQQQQHLTVNTLHTQEGEVVSEKKSGRSVYGGGQPTSAASNIATPTATATATKTPVVEIITQQTQEKQQPHQHQPQPQHYQPHYQSQQQQHNVSNSHYQTNENDDKRQRQQPKKKSSSSGSNSNNRDEINKYVVFVDGERINLYRHPSYQVYNPSLNNGLGKVRFSAVSNFANQRDLPLGGANDSETIEMNYYNNNNNKNSRNHSKMLSRVTSRGTSQVRSRSCGDALGGGGIGFKDSDSVVVLGSSFTSSADNNGSNNFTSNTHNGNNVVEVSAARQRLTMLANMSLASVGGGTFPGGGAPASGGDTGSCLYVGRRRNNQDPVPGRWYCPSCKYYNLAANMVLDGAVVCQQCHAKQPGQQQQETQQKKDSDSVMQRSRSAGAEGSSGEPLQHHKPLLYSSSSEFPNERWFCRDCGYYNLGVLYRKQGKGDDREKKEVCQSCGASRRWTGGGQQDILVHPGSGSAPSSATNKAKNDSDIPVMSSMRTFFSRSRQAATAVTVGFMDETPHDANFTAKYNEL